MPTIITSPTVAVCGVVVHQRERELRQILLLELLVDEAAISLKPGLECTGKHPPFPWSGRNRHHFR